MAYQSDKPQPTDKRNASQADFLGNFIALNTFLKVNHVELNDVNQGKHTKVEFTKQTTHPKTEVDEMMIYNNGNKLYVKNQNVPLATEGFDISSFTAATTGHTILPSGLVILWGTVTITAGSNSGQVALTKEIASIYGFSYGTRMGNPNTADPGNLSITNKNIATAGNITTITLTRPKTADTAHFDFIILGK